MPWHADAWRLLSGADTPARRGLPASELLAPLPLIALAVLGLNDWVLKGSSAPGWLTGKLSDFAGLFVFPLVATASLDLGLLAVARLGLPVDFTLRRWKLAVMIALTGFVFSAMKLSPDVASGVARALSTMMTSSRVTVDPTDLIAIPMLAGTWLHGCYAIARIPHGRLELVERRHTASRPLVAPFADAIVCGASPTQIHALDEAVAAWLLTRDATGVDVALAPLRN